MEIKIDSHSIIKTLNIKNENTSYRGLRSYIELEYTSRIGESYYHRIPIHKDMSALSIVDISPRESKFIVTSLGSGEPTITLTLDKGLSDYHGIMQSLWNLIKND